MNNNILTAANIPAEIRAVIFDMDGVIVDSEHLHYETDSRIFEHFSILVQEKERYQFVGMSVQKFYETICTQYAPHLSPEYMIEFDRKYRARFFRHARIKANDHITELLGYLEKRNIKRALASGSSQELIEIILRKLDLMNSFEVVLSSERVPRPKPWPDVFLRAAELLNTPPDQCLVIEDSMLGIQAARAAGMLCIGYNGKNGNHQDLSGADFTIESFQSLIKEFQ